MQSKEERSRKQRERRRANRLEAEQERGPCKKCGSTVDLQFHHRNPLTKNCKLSNRIWNWSKERRNAELDKCDCYCSTHHKAIHKDTPELQALLQFVRRTKKANNGKLPRSAQYSDVHNVVVPVQATAVGAAVACRLQKAPTSRRNSSSYDS